ncbi:MAG: 2-oxo acid dehydrogenase subunit E2 [Pseudomonadota bacterium]|nr:2-oxo acid dehydrogenase subunit E2 [Pseudomonadota bacterium]
MTLSFLLPDLGEGLQEATIAQWHVTSGTEVALDQVVCSVETAKSLIDITAPCAATITHLHAKAGETIAVNAALFSYSETNPGLEETTASPIKTSSKPTSQTQCDPDLQIISEQKSFIPSVPRARKLADEYKIDLADVISWSKKDMVSVSCVEEYIKQHPTNKTSAEPKHFPVQEALKNHTHMAWQQAVQTVVMDEFDITPWFKQKNINWVILQALCALWSDNPKIFSRVSDDQKTLHVPAKFHVAMPVYRGTYTQIVLLHDVDKMTEASFSQSLQAIKDDQASSHEDYSQAHTILSNVGAFGGRFATPLCIPPLLSTIAVGKASLRPAVVDGEVKPRFLLPLSLGCDHRYVEGAEMITALQSIGRYLSTFLA